MSSEGRNGSISVCLLTQKLDWLVIMCCTTRCSCCGMLKPDESAVSEKAYSRWSVLMVKAANKVFPFSQCYFMMTFVVCMFLMCLFTMSQQTAHWIHLIQSLHFRGQEHCSAALWCCFALTVGELILVPTCCDVLKRGIWLYWIDNTEIMYNSLSLCFRGGSEILQIHVKTKWIPCCCFVSLSLVSLCQPLSAWFSTHVVHDFKWLRIELLPCVQYSICQVWHFGYLRVNNVLLWSL